MQDHHFQIGSEMELIGAFRSRDRKHVLIPRSMRFPIGIDHLLAWTEPSGVRIFLVCKNREWRAPVGIAFRRDQQGVAVSPPGMCEWCLSTGPSDQIGLLTATVDSKTRVGVNLCLDLGCIQKLETLSSTSGVRLEKLTARLHERMDRFVREAVLIEPR